MERAYSIPPLENIADVLNLTRPKLKVCSSPKPSLPRAFSVSTDGNSIRPVLRPKLRVILNSHLSLTSTHNPLGYLVCSVFKSDPLSDLLTISSATTIIDSHLNDCIVSLLPLWPPIVCTQFHNVSWIMSLLCLQGHMASHLLRGYKFLWWSSKRYPIWPPSLLPSHR